MDQLPATDAVYSLAGPAGEIRYRHFAKLILGSDRTPQLRAIRINGRYAVYYSRYDLSAGLVGEPVDGIVGYEPDSATQIMSGVILHALAGH